MLTLTPVPKNLRQKMATLSPVPKPCGLLRSMLHSTSALSAQLPAPPIIDGQVSPLWVGAAPGAGALGNADIDIPTITAYLPRVTPAGMTAVIVCPGGAYSHLAMNHEGRQVASRPDFSVLGYPVISLVESWTHQRSKDNLLGLNADPQAAKRLSGEQAVTKDTPPTFIFETNADQTVPAENATYYFLVLRKAGVTVALHAFETGAHGVGLAMDDAALSERSCLLTNWLRVRAVIKQRTARTAPDALSYRHSICDELTLLARQSAHSIPNHYYS